MIRDERWNRACIACRGFCWYRQASGMRYLMVLVPFIDIISDRGESVNIK